MPHYHGSMMFHGIFTKSHAHDKCQGCQGCQGTIDLIFMKLDTDHEADGQQAMDRECIHNLFALWRQEAMRHQDRLSLHCCLLPLFELKDISKATKT